MEPALLVALALALLVGVSLGLLGGGGSILTVPILTYVIGMEPREAIASSLLIVGITSVGGLIAHAREQRVRWNVGVLFGIAGMGGAFLGGLAGGVIPGVVLMILFAIMMVVTAIAMIRGRKTEAAPSSETGKKQLPLVRIVGDGAIVGFATGLVGAGGGFLIVPALNLLGGLPIAVAVGTSLLVIVLKSFAGFAGYLLSVQINWPVVGAFSATALIGSFIGSRIAGIIPEQALRKGFGVFVLVMGAFVLFQEAPSLVALLGGSA